MGAKQPFRYAQGMQQLQDRWKAKNYRLSKTRQRKPVQTLRKMDHHSKTLQNLQQHCSRASRYRLKVCTKQTQSQSRGSGFAPHGSLCDPRKSAFGTCTLLRKVPFSLWRKVPPVPLLREAGTNLHLFQEKGKTIPLPREREKDVPFVL